MADDPLDRPQPTESPDPLFGQSFIPSPAPSATPAPQQQTADIGGFLSSLPPSARLAFAGLAQQFGLGGQEAESLPLSTTESEGEERVTLKGYHSATKSALLFEPYKLNTGAMLQLQRNLAAAGYLDKSQASKIIPGWYDERTLVAYAALIEEAQRADVKPMDLLKHRIKIASGKGKKGDAIFQDEVSPEEHKKSLADAYVRVWGRVAPPGYLDSLLDLNPDELTYVEKAKESWQDSPIGRDNTESLQQALARFLGGK